MASVSFRVASTTSLAHNNRENLSGNPDINKDRIRDNITYVKEDIEKIYKREFDEAVAEYNAKQKRSDRKIKDYYRKILNDSKTHHQRELIVAIGKKDDGIDEEFKKSILNDYAQEFQENNPNLIVYNSVLHMDEANPHLHINYIPTYNATRGLKKRVGHDKAIEQQGYKNFTEWQADQREELEILMGEYDLEREHVGTHKYMSVPEYKKLKEDVQKLQQEKKSLNQEQKILSHEIERRRDQLNKLPNLENIDVEVESRPNLLRQNEITVKKEDFEQIQELASQAKAQSEKSNLYHNWARQEQSKAQRLETNNQDLTTENRGLNYKIFQLETQVNKAEKKAAKLENKFKKLVGMVMEFIHDLINLFPEYISEKLFYFINSFEKKIKKLERSEQTRLNEKSRGRDLEL